MVRRGTALPRTYTETRGCRDPRSPTRSSDSKRWPRWAGKSDGPTWWKSARFATPGRTWRIFCEQYDGVIELYNSKFANPGLAFMKLPKENGPVTEVQFDEDVEWTWWEIWHD